MNVSRESRQLARLASGAILTLGLAAASLAGPGLSPAQAFVKPPLPTQSVAVSWGSNASGQLGDGLSDAGNVNNDRSLYGSVSVLGGNVTEVSAGANHGLALTSDGRVWAWGDNTAGELGNGTTTASTVPVLVPGLSGVTQVAAGVNDSYALRSDGTVWAWGAGDQGELGFGTFRVSSTFPVQVPGLADITQIAAGSHFALALRSDGTVWAWGYNGDGQLGDGNTAASAVPVQVSGLTRVSQIAAGYNSALAVHRISPVLLVTAVDAWGGNAAGQLGDGTQTDRLTPVQVTGIPAAAQIAVGGSDSLVLASDGSVWGWGADYYGEIGNAPTSTPELRPMETIGPGSTIIQISAGNDHALALRSNGTVLAWGHDLDGQLGNGVFGFSGPPAQVTGLTGATQVSAGLGFSLAVRTVPLTLAPPQP